MLIGSFVDTILNLITFAFLGACVWLLLRDLPDRADTTYPDNENAD